MSALPNHSPAFRARRVLNWLPLGLAYGFMYMGRYNLTVAKNALGDLMTEADFGEIFGFGALVYGLSFLVNGPLTDRIGGRRIMLTGVLGTLTMNGLMGLTLYGIANWGWDLPIFGSFLLLYAGNMYFQSFGAVAIVTVKAPWFHVRERGSFSSIFGIMISLGIYFAFDWGHAVRDATRAVVSEDIGVIGRVVRAVFGVGGTGVDQNWWIFFVPTILLTVLWVTLFVFLRNRPSEAGHDDFDTGEGSVSDDGERLPIKVIFWKIITHPVLLVICGIEFCSGVMRNGVMHWYLFFAEAMGFRKEFFISANWGLSLLAAGILGALITGWASDRFFQSRRAPMSAVLYGLMVVCAVVMCLSLDANPWFMGMAVILISMSVIGVHGIMSGTSTVDFGGTKNAGAAVGIVDGLVYLGTGIQSVSIGWLAPTGDARLDPNAWVAWPLFLVPFAIIGTVLSLRIWNALPKGRTTAVPAQSAADESSQKAA